VRTKVLEEKVEMINPYVRGENNKKEGEEVRRGNKCLLIIF